MKSIHSIIASIGSFVLAFATLGSSTTASAHAIPPQQSTSGPVPPASAGPKRPLIINRETGNVAIRTITGVPGYGWRHGCGPTAVGMVVGYWDARGFPDCFAGEADTQTAEVDQGIASQGSGTRGSGTQRHYEDYALPDDSGIPIVPDSSEAYPANCHGDDCIADFMHTSWSVDWNRYGWSWSSRVIPAFTAYLNLRNPAYSFQCASLYMQDQSLDWSVLTNEIAHDRPMVFLVDSRGDGCTDHFVTVIGYAEDGPTRQYACLDTWYPPEQVRWCEFRGMSSSYPWGIWGGWSFQPNPPAKATSPNPPDGATEQSVDSRLSWAGAANAASYDVYLNGQFRGNQTETNCQPGALTYGAACCWRIDTRNAGGVTTGDSWSFATIAPRLLVERGDTNIVLLWPTNAVGFTLEYATNLSAPDWTEANPAPAIEEGQFAVTNGPVGPGRLYRLSR